MPERLSTFPNSRGGGPAYNTDYTLSLRPDKQELKLTFKQSFLQVHEWSNGDISPEITFTADDGRKFGKKFSMNLKVNTAPVLEYAGIGKTTVSGEDYYVLLFRAKDMGTMIGTQHVHKDINIMNVTAGGVSLSPITLSVTGSDFASTSTDILASTDVASLDSSSLPSPLPPDWLLRLKTDVKVGGPETEYSVSIKDLQGLSSAVISAKTKKNKLLDVKLFDGSAEITGTSESNLEEFPGISGKPLTAKAAPAGTTITGSIAKFDSSTWTQISGGTVSGTTTAAINLPALGTGIYEERYKITLKAQLSGYDDSGSKDFFVKLVRQEVPVLKLIQDFSASGDAFKKNISTAADGYVTKDIIQDAGNYNNFTNALVIYNLNNKAAFEIAPRTGSDATVKYILDGVPETSSTTPARIKLNTPGSHTLKLWAVKDGIEGPKTTVYIKVVTAVSNYTQLKNVIKNAPPAGNEIQINIGGNITALSGDTEIAVLGGKNLKLIPTSGSPICTIDAGGNGRIFKISGSGTVLNLEDIKLEGGYVADGTGGAVYVEDGGTLELTGKTVITPSTGSEINTKGKNDVYLATGTSIKVDSTLTTTEPIVARITPQIYDESKQVLTGISVGTNYTKFSVTQPAGSTDIWKIKNNGKLQKISAVINGSDSGAWKRLKEAVEKLPEGSTITINGEIAATSDSGNSGEIVIDKNLTIQGKSGAGLDILNANSSGLGTNAHRIFKVEPGKKLTLKNLTLKNGKNNETYSGGSSNPKGKGGAIYSKGELEIRNVLITGCEAKYSGGGIYCSMSGSSAADERKLVIENTEVTSCKAPEPNYGTGGGVYIVGENCLMNVKLSDVKIKNNEASFSAAGLCLHGSHGAKTTADSVVLTRVTLHENKLTDTGARGGAGMVFATYDRDSAITLKNCTVTKNESKTSGGGISLHTSSSGLVNGKLILEDSSVTENKAQNGGGIYVDWSNLVIKNSVLTSNTATDEGGGVYVAKGTFEMEGSSRITPSTDNAKGKNDVYLEEHLSVNAKIKLDSALTGTAPFARITVADDKYLPSTQVLDGSAVSTEHTKFTVTPKGSEEWGIGSDGKLKKAKVIDGGTETAWKTLKEAVAAAEDGDVITINGRIKAGKYNNNNGEITINNNITIRGDDSSNDILDANKNVDNKPKHRIFKVNDGKKLILENLTLTGGWTQGPGHDEHGNGGAIYVDGGILNMTGCTVSENTAEANGGGIYVKNGTVELKNTIIGGNQYYTGTTPNMLKGNIARKGNGGGIYITGDREKTFNMENCTVSFNLTENNDSDSSGGGICIYNAAVRVTMNGGAIKNNKVSAGQYSRAIGGGVYIFGAKAEFIMQGDNPEIYENKVYCSSSGDREYGGGVALSSKGKFRMKSGIIKNNTAKYGKGVYLAFAKDGSNNPLGFMFMSRTAQVDISNDVYLETGQSSLINAFISVESGLTGDHTAKLTMENSPQGYKPGRIVVIGEINNADINRFPITMQTKPTTQKWTTEMNTIPSSPPKNCLKLKKEP